MNIGIIKYMFSEYSKLKYHQMNMFEVSNNIDMSYMF